MSDLIEKCLIAFLTEKSAQCGEPFYMDMWEEYKREQPELFSEEMVQMQCALEVYESGMCETIKKMAEALRQADALITEITPELSDAPKYPDKWHEQYDITQALALAEPYLRGK